MKIEQVYLIFGGIATVTGFVVDVGTIVGWIKTKIEKDPGANQSENGHSKIPIFVGTMVVAVGILVFLYGLGWIKMGSGSDSGLPISVSSDPVFSYSVTPDPPSSESVEYYVGQSISFGNYPQGSNGEIKPIDWIVLEVQSDRVLLISEKLLDYVPYNNVTTSITWKNSTLRTWMNDTFLNKAFSRSEQSMILPVENKNPDNPKYDTNGGGDTRDSVFALNINEASLYFSSSSKRKAYTTAYARSKGYDNDDHSDTWWLRSPGYDSKNAACVTPAGSINQNGSNVFFGVDITVRPALWKSK